MLDNKTKMINAMKKLNEAMNEINILWEQFNLDEQTNHGVNYPFEQSFDEVTLKVDTWVDHTIEEITQKIEYVSK